MQNEEGPSCTNGGGGGGSFNLMEQLLLAKIERQSCNEAKRDNSRPCGRCSSSLILRADSLDSQTSLNSLASLLSGSGDSSRYCSCDDCLLGIGDVFQQQQQQQQQQDSTDSTTTSSSSRANDRAQRKKSSGWRKLRSIVHWTPFFQTYKKQRYPWVQLAGHQGNFRPGPKPGTILKKLCPQEEACFQLLMKDVLRPYVPEYLGALELRSEEQQPSAKVEGAAAAAAVEASQTATDNHKNNNVNNNNNNNNNNINNNNNSNSNGATGCKDSYLQLQDLLADFKEPCVMDCKVGVRTYLESELAKAKERPKLRKDMYEKMVQVDPTAPSDEERQLQGVTKPRYMVWRETISSTATLGFRVEGIKLAQAGSSKDFKTTRTRQQVMDAIRRFVEGYPHAAGKYLQRLQAIRATLRASSFFAGHEVVGSSLLFVHDARAAGVWMIDFAKTLPLPEHLERIRHDAVWQVGNHEDGYLIGVNNLIDIFKEIVADGVVAVDGGVEAAAAEAVVVDDHDGPT